MADDPILIAPVVHQHAEQPAAAIVQHTQSRLATAAEIEAADRIFANEEQERELVSGLMGMYAGTMLLGDLAAEHLARDKEEEDETDEAEEEPAV